MRSGAGAGGADSERSGAGANADEETIVRLLISQFMTAKSD